MMAILTFLLVTASKPFICRKRKPTKFKFQESSLHNQQAPLASDVDTQPAKYQKLDVINGDKVSYTKVSSLDVHVDKPTTFDSQQVPHASDEAITSISNRASLKTIEL